VRRLVICVTVVVAGCHTRVPSSPRPESSWVGCYSLNRTEWETQPEAILVGLPGRQLELHASRAAQPRFYGGPQLPAARFAASAGEWTGAWWLAGEDSIQVSLGGLAGVVLSLHRTALDSVAGTAETFTDILRLNAPPETVVVDGVPIASYRWVTRAHLAGHRSHC